MKKKILKVPAHVSKISQWAEIEELLPEGQFILNKVFPGCGMTHYFLHSDQPVVLCAPRNSLLRNKTEQLLKERKDNDGIILSLSGNEVDFFYYTPSTKTNEAQRRQENEQLFNALRNFCRGEYMNPFSERKFVPKILVTYDSLPAIYPIIAESGIPYRIVPDEAHMLFMDYLMKPDVIERTLRILEKHPNVCYLSATPIMESYLERMETFKDLPYIEFEWPAERIKNTLVTYLPMQSTVKQACQVIENFKQDGIFDSITTDDGKSYNSTEAVFFVNNVKSIIDIIRAEELQPYEVNILVSHEPGNKRMIGKLGADYGYGKIPLKGQPHKTYTFCSKAVFFGCDFYSTSASTYVFADANVRSMATDISLDLHQIVGRQRLESNKFKNRCTVFVKTTKGELPTKEEFDKEQYLKWERSKRICEEWNYLSQDSLSAIKVNASKCPYGVIYEDPITGQWVSKNSINALLSEEHAWDLRNRVYKDHETVQYLMSCDDFTLTANDDLPLRVLNFYNEFLSVRGTADKMRMFCEFFDRYPDLKRYIGQLSSIDADYKNYYNLLGTKRIAKHQFVLSQIKPEYEATCKREFLASVYYDCFGDVGNYTKADIKSALREIYNRYNIPKAAKATELADFYNMQEIKITVNGQRINGFRLTRK